MWKQAAKQLGDDSLFVLFFHLNTETKYLVQPIPEKEPRRSSEGTDGAECWKTALSQKQRGTCHCRCKQQQVPSCVLQQWESRRQRSLQVQQKCEQCSPCVRQRYASSSENAQKIQREETPEDKKIKKNTRKSIYRGGGAACRGVQCSVPGYLNR